MFTVKQIQATHRRVTATTCFLILFSFLHYAHSFAQDIPERYDSITAFIQEAMNQGQPEKIYALTAGPFRDKMTEAQFATGMNKFRAKSGDWKSYTYHSQDEKGRNYLAAFALTKQLFSLRLNKEGNIERINFAAMPASPGAKDYQVLSNNPLADTLDRCVEQLIRPYIQKGHTAGLVLAVIKNGQTRRYSYGTVNKATQQLPDAATTIFEIGSVSKTFTSLLLAQQVAIGAMQLNDAINRYLPDSVPSLHFRGKPMRLVHLANHTSGFPRLPANIFNGAVDPKNPYLHYVPDSLYSFLVHYRPAVEPGTVFSYSNYAAGLLGTILEQQLRMSYDQVIVEKIAKPLGMNTTFVALPASAAAQFAQGYNENGMATSPWDLASLKGSGAIRSTLNDMLLYTHAQLGDNNPLAEAIRLSHELTFPGPGQAMALGWRINNAGQQTYYHHSGGTGGFRSFVGFDINRQFGIVILSNTAEDVTAIGESLLKSNTSGTGL